MMCKLYLHTTPYLVQLLSNISHTGNSITIKKYLRKQSFDSFIIKSITLFMHNEYMIKSLNKKKANNCVTPIY